MSPGDRGQTAILLLGVVAALLLGAGILGAIGNALGAKWRHQRAADLAAMSAARAMGAAWPRLFEPAFLEGGVPNPRHLSTVEFVGLARRVAVRGARLNGVRVRAADVRLSDGFAPTRVTVVARGQATVRIAREGPRARRTVPVAARATAEIGPGADAAFDQPAFGSGGGYDGPLAYRMGKGMRPDVARAFDRMAAAARREAGLSRSISSAFRSDAEQARLFAANPNPKWVAPPGTSLHRYATELDLAPPAAYAWLKANCRRFGFIHRYAWEGWHYGLPLALYRGQSGGLSPRGPLGLRSAAVSGRARCDVAGDVMTTLRSSHATDEMGRGDSAPGAIYKARLGRVPRGRMGDAGILRGGDPYF